MIAYELTMREPHLNSPAMLEMWKEESPSSLGLWN
jgi:hypothetical protein